MILLLSLCLIAWILVDVTGVVAPWRQVCAAAVIFVIVLGLLGVVHVGHG